MFVYGEEVFHPVPRLDQHAQYAVGLAARRCGDALGHFLLYHARATGNQVFVFQHLEEYLAGDVVGIVPGQHERLSVEQAFEVHLQEVVLDDVVLQFRIVVAQVGHRLVVHLHHLERAFLLQQELRQHAHARSHFQDGEAGTGVHGVGYVLRHLQVFQEMLAQELLWLD